MENNKETSFAEEIENLYRIHYIAKKSDHEIQLNGRSVKSFEPTKFYYAYSAFNAFYNFDWEESLKSQKLVIISREEKEPSEQAKFKKMIKFILLNASDEEKGEFCKLICGGKKTEGLIEIISKITPDKYIKEEKIENFKDTFKNLIKTKKIKTKKFIEDIIIFIYLVRNNVIHGTKDIIKMSDNCQKNRLEIYTNILLCLNELLFKILKRKKSFIPQKEYHLENSKGSDSNDKRRL